MSDKPALVCLNCERSEVEIPLVSLRYRGKEAWICSACMPQLIHQADLLVEKLAVAVSD